MSSSALKAAATGQVAQQRTILDYLNDPRVASRMSAVASQFLSPDRMLSLCINAVKRTPLLAKCDPQSVLGAMMASAALGLEPNTVQQQAFLIPYKKRRKEGRDWVDVYECQFQVGARGFITLAYRSPQIKSLTAGAIHEGDLWEHMEGSAFFLKYAKALRNRGALIGAFSHVHLANGGELACVLPLDEIYKIRSKSESFRYLSADLEQARNAGDPNELRKVLAKYDETPWVMWEDDMAYKSAIKKHAKQLPLAAGDAMAQAAAIDDRSEAGVIDMSALADPDQLREVVAHGAEPPQLADDPTPGFVSSEGFASRERSAAGVAPAANHAAGPAPADAHPGAASGGWQPTAEEQAAIRQRELAEAGGGTDGEPPRTPSAAAPQPRTARANRSSAE